MRKYLPIIAILATIKLGVHLVGNRNYGFQRDELLHLSVGRHLDFGYMEFPPFIGWLGGLSNLIFGDSFYGMRLFSTLAGIVILIVCCLMVKEFGGKRNAILLAGVAILAFLPYYRNHMLFQPVAFDQMFWTLGFYFIVKYINTQNSKFLIWFGFVAGFGLLNKYTFLVWGIGVTVGLLCYEKGKLYRTQYFYLAGIIASLLFLPNAIWQYQHDFPIFKHLQKLTELQLDEMGPYDFLLDQVKIPLTFAFSLLGLFALLFSKDFKKYQSIGISSVIIFVLMWYMQSKGYYFYAIYPLLFAAAAAKTEQLFKRHPSWNYAIAAILIFPVFFYLPKAIPILAIDKHLAYENLKPDASGHYKLTGDYADMFGWEEQVKLVDSAYRSLSNADRVQCLIFAGNYGEAGAIGILGQKYGLPHPVCANGSFWLWGAGNTSGEVAIVIGVEKKFVEQMYAESQLVKTIRHPYAVDEENNIGLYLCRQPKINLKQIWPSLESRIFD